MRAVEVAVRVHHFRFYPEAEHQAHLIDLFRQPVDTGGQFLFVDRPVAQGAMVAVALAEPAVIEHKQLRTEPRALLRDGEDALLCKGEIRRLPVVDNNRALPVLPLAAHNMLLDESMHVAAHAV